MKLNTTGITRIVIELDNYVIKIPRINYGWMKFIEGIYCNLSERQCWKMTKSEYLCPTIVSIGGLVNIMPKVTVSSSDDDLNQIPNEDGEDRKPDNYGWLNNKLVCIDYAYHRIKLHNRLKQN